MLQTHSKNSSQVVSLHMAMWTEGASWMYGPATSKATRNIIGSLASGDGHLPCASQVGLMTAPCGPAVALANLSARQVQALGLLTSGTSGRSGITSSNSAKLQSSLENKLRARLQNRGSTLFKTTWKPWAMPSGRLRSRLRASVLRTDGTEPIGFPLQLPTPSATSNHGKNHVAGRLDEWGGSSNPFRGTPIGRVHCPAFELWVMGYPDAWAQLMPPGMPSSRSKPRHLSAPISTP